jgi:hypothetical protein
LKTDRQNAAQTGRDDFGVGQHARRDADVPVALTRRTTHETDSNRTIDSA